MKNVMIEIRDRCTCIPAMAVVISGSYHNKANRILERAGICVNDISYPCVILIHLDKMVAHSDPFDWDDRTMLNAHRAIYRDCAGLVDGDVVDVEYELGETKERKASEIN